MDFPLAFQASVHDPINQQLVRAGVQLIFRGSSDDDLLPIHVTGGVPINKFLRDLVENFTYPPTDYRFSLVPSSVGSDQLDSNGDPLDPAMNTSESFRVGFVNSLMRWMDKHRRRCLQIPGIEKPVYVWESITQVPDHSAVSDGSSAGPIPDVNPSIAPAPVDEPAVPDATMHVHLNRYVS